MKKVALLVGIEQYEDRTISPVLFARADAMAFAKRLRERCSFDHVKTLTEAKGPGSAYLGNVIDALRDLAGELHQNDLFLFFFAGHGVEVDGQGYLLTRESRLAFPEHGSLSLALLRKTFGRLPASRRLLLLDACRNSPHAGKGDAANPMGPGLRRDIAAVASIQASVGTLTVLFSACGPGERAWEWPGKGHGVFTHYLLEGIDKAAWKTKELEFEDLAAYTTAEVARWCSATPGINQPQHCWYEKFGQPGRLVLARRSNIFHRSVRTLFARAGQPDTEDVDEHDDQEEVFDVDCPWCGLTFEIDEGDGVYICPYDGAEVVVGDEDEDDSQKEVFDADCPWCDLTFEIDEGDGEYTCPYCDNEVIVGDEDEDNDDLEEAFDVDCPWPRCRRTFEIDEGNGEYTCPYCENEVIVGDEDEDSGDLDEAFDVDCPWPRCRRTFEIDEGDGEYTCPYCENEVIIGGEDEDSDDLEETFDVDCPWPRCRRTFEIDEGDGEYTCPYCGEDVVVGQ